MGERTSKLFYIRLTSAATLSRSTVGNTRSILEKIAQKYGNLEERPVVHIEIW
jgi:hypothetical protein